MSLSSMRLLNESKKQLIPSEEITISKEMKGSNKNTTTTIHNQIKLPPFR